MRQPKKNPLIPFDQIKQGYNLAVENAIRCLGASQKISDEYPDKALALAELGQEELGKSLTVLAAAALPADIKVWSWFWNGWQSHKLKAHRAYLYEIIHPLRIQVPLPDGSKYDGLPLKKPISREKEIGFYVDFDVDKMIFLNPKDQVSKLDAFCRMSTLVYLCAIADAVRRALFFTDEDFRIHEFGKIALRLCSEQIYQQDWPSIKKVFSDESERHNSLISDLDIALKGVSDSLQGAKKTTA